MKDLMSRKEAEAVLSMPFAYHADIRQKAKRVIADCAAIERRVDHMIDAGLASGRSNEQIIAALDAAIASCDEVAS